MNEIWNETCVIITKDGDVIKSIPMAGGHNTAISFCAQQIGLDIDPMQSMVTMMEKIVASQNIILLNGGRRIDDEGNVRRGGYLALPNRFVGSQLEMVEHLKATLDEFQGLTTWKMEEGRLKTKSMGDTFFTVAILDEMLTQMNNSDIIIK